MVERLPLLVRIDARRAASWIVAVTAGCIAACLTVVPDAPPLAVALGGLLAVAAIGDVPRTGSAALDALWILARGLWPLAGWMTAASVRGEMMIAGWGGAGIAAGCLLAGVLARLDLTAADGTAIALVATAVSAATGWCAARLAPGGATAGFVAVATLLACVSCAAVVVWSALVAQTARYAARLLLTTGAMTSAVLGMVAWLLLDPESARLDLAVSLAWFVALAIPAATLGDGASHLAVWRLAEHATPRGAGRTGLRVPGRRRDSVRALLGAAAILGWPPFVAACVAGPGGGRMGAAGIVVVLAICAVLLLVLMALGESVGVRPETELAVALACSGLAVAATLVAATGRAPAFPLFLVGGG